MTTRYKNQDIFTNLRAAYRNYLKERGQESIVQYNTPKFKHPTSSEIRDNFNVITHIWSTGDRYFKLADEFYGNPELWWIIALYNQKPTEFHVKQGETILIPVPLDAALYYMGY